MEYILKFTFKDVYGYETDDEMTIFIGNDISESAKQTIAEDWMTCKVYELAYFRVVRLWKQLNGGNDEDKYEKFFDDYVKGCTYSYSLIRKEQ